MLNVRDAWQRQSRASIRNSPFRQFRDWVLATYESPDDEAVPAVTELLSVIVGGNPRNYSVDTLKEKLGANVHSRSYRLTFACDSDDADYRVRHFFLTYIEHPASIGLRAFLCLPWTYAHRERAPHSGNLMAQFPVERFTPFQRILAITHLRIIHERMGEVRGRKRRARGSASSTTSASAMVNGVPIVLRNMSDTILHRLCYAVQRVDHCWSRFFKRYGWNDVETFLHPYVLYNPTTSSISVIETREEGFPPDVDINASGWPRAGELTSIPQASSAEAVNRDAVTDVLFRKAAQAFLDHAFTVVTSSTLYRVAAASDWATGATLASRSTTRAAPAMATALPADVKAYFDARHESRSAASGSQRSGSRSGSGTRHNTGGQDTSGAAGSQPADRRAPGTSAAGTTGGTTGATTTTTTTTGGRRQQYRPRLMLGPAPSPEELATAVDKVRTFLVGHHVHVYNCDFDELIESHDMLGTDRREISDRVQLMLLDPPFNVRREKELPNSEYDRLSFGDMMRVVNRSVELLRQGGHVIIMCTREQHMVWTRLYETVPADGFDADDMAKGDDDTLTDPYSVMADMRDSEVTNLFGITRDPLLYANKPYHYAHGARYAATHQNGVQYAFHAKRNGLSPVEERNRVDWRSHGYIQSTYPAYKHIIDNVPRLAPGEQVRMTETVQDAEGSEDGNEDEIQPADPTPRTRTRALRAEQKPLPLLQEIICRYTKPGDIIVDFFAGTFSTAVAAMSLPQHRTFIGTELDKACYDVAVDSMCRRIAVYLASRQTDITIPHDLLPALDVLQVAHVRARHRDPSWEAPPSMPQYQQLPRAVVAAVASSAENPSWVLDYVAEPVDRWPAAMHVALQNMDDTILLQADCAANGVMIMPSTVKHPMAGRGCFASRSFQEDDLVGTYYGTLVYHNLFDRTRAPRKEYGQGVMNVTRHSYMTNAFRVTKAKKATGFGAVTDLTDGHASIHIVPPVFCSMRYINDARYIDGDSDKQRFSDNGGRSANVRYFQSATKVRTPKDLESLDVVEVRAIRVINPGEELFGDYGSGYLLFHSNEFHEGRIRND